MRIFAGEFKGRILKSTSGPGLRPAMGRVREALFSILDSQGIKWPETRALDLFAGTGSLGFEALSRGAKHLTFVEMAPYATKILKENCNTLDLSSTRARVVESDVAKFLSRKTQYKYSFVFIDPPYKLKVLNKTIHALINNQWLEAGAIINAELDIHLKLDPKTISSKLELLDDRAYGQSRVLIWKMKN